MERGMVYASGKGVPQDGDKNALSPIYRYGDRFTGPCQDSAKNTFATNARAFWLCGTKSSFCNSHTAFGGAKVFLPFHTAHKQIDLLDFSRMCCQSVTSFRHTRDPAFKLRTHCDLEFAHCSCLYMQCLDIR